MGVALYPWNKFSQLELQQLFRYSSNTVLHVTLTNQTLVNPLTIWQKHMIKP